MATLIPLDYSQPPNTLTAIANNQRTVNQVKNDYVPTADEYSVTAPDAMAVVERKLEIKINKYNKNKTYPDF
jgi:hypothetical protein